MSFVLSIQKFLLSKFQTEKINRKDFIQCVNMPPSMVSGLINGTKVNPMISSITKIADYFNCSTDKVLGRQDYVSSEEEYIFNKIGLYDIADNIRSYITSELVKRNIDTKSLSKLPGIGSSTILEFIKEGSSRKDISTKTVIAIADYFNVSIDEMIGRVDKPYTPNKQ